MGDERRRERVIERHNLLRARARVNANGRSPGLDGRTVAALPGDLPQQWPERRARRRSGSYRPRPVKWVAISNPGGGGRKLGIPTGRGA
jgi:RNA-directed DNA polymerase